MRRALLAAMIAAGCDDPHGHGIVVPPEPVALDAAPPADPETAAKLDAYRALLAEVDGTLHAHRLAYRAEWLEWSEWRWPTWLEPDVLEARLAATALLVDEAPALPADLPARAWIAAVRAVVPIWRAAHEAWKQGAAAYGAHAPAIRASFEQLGEASAALRAAVPAASSAAGSWPAMAELCLAGSAIAARMAPPVKADAVAVEADLERASVYGQPLDGELRIAGLKCAQAALDLLDQARGKDVWLAQQGVQLGMFLVAEEERRADHVGGYVTSLENYVQFAVLMFHDAAQHP